MKSGWLLKIANGITWRSNNGVMKTGWEEIDGKWYYFDATGAMKTGWISDNSKDYCLYSSGAMIGNKVLMDIALIAMELQLN